MHRRRGPAFTLLIAAAMLATACSLTIEVEGPSTTVRDEFELSDLVGDWENGELFLQVADDGTYQAMETPSSEPAEPIMGGFVARDGINVNFVTDIFGECAGQTGVYEVLVVGDQLMLVLVDDPCHFRATRFVETWERLR